MFIKRKYELELIRVKKIIYANKLIDEITDNSERFHKFREANMYNNPKLNIFIRFRGVLQLVNKTMCEQTSTESLYYKKHIKLINLFKYMCTKNEDFLKNIDYTTDGTAVQEFTDVEINIARTYINIFEKYQLHIIEHILSIYKTASKTEYNDYFMNEIRNIITDLKKPEDASTLELFYKNNLYFYVENDVTGDDIHNLLSIDDNIFNYILDNVYNTIMMKTSNTNNNVDTPAPAMDTPAVVEDTPAPAMDTPAAVEVVRGGKTKKRRSKKTLKKIRGRSSRRKYTHKSYRKSR